MRTARASVVLALGLTIIGLGPARVGPSLSGAHAAAGPGDRVADAVLGQADFVSGGCNRSGQRTRSTLCEPIALTIDRGSGRLYANDDLNYRVLGYPSANFALGDPADLVFGQPDFSSRTKCPRVPTATSLCRTGKPAVDRLGNLYVPDRKYNRIVVYSDPATTDSVADRVFGQPDFNSKGCRGATAGTVCGPRGVEFDSQQNLWVIDRPNNRILMYEDPLTHDALADFVIGAPDLNTKGTCKTPPSASDLCDPRGMDIDASGNLWVSDTLNNRVLVFLDPLRTDRVADLVIGQPDFQSKACSPTISEANFCDPRDVEVYQGATTQAVYIVDLYRSRVLAFFNVFSSDRMADRVFGQASFGRRGCNSGGLNAESLCNPRGLHVDARGNLYVADSNNYRILRFDTPVQ
jgi:hypothetical protein